MLPGYKAFVFSTSESLVGRDSSVGIATGYGLDSPAIESLWGEIFHARPDLGVKWPWIGVDHPPHLALRLKKE
jgi:hypothetical protein